MSQRTIIDDIVWFIPIKRLRDKVRDYLHKRLYVDNFKIDTIEHVKKLLIKTTPQEYISNLVVRITEHCNFNCYGCNAFSQLAKKTIYDIDVFEKDIKRMYELSKGYVRIIGIEGGGNLY